MATPYQYEFYETKISIGVPGIDLSGGHGGHGNGMGKIAVLDAKTGTY